MASKAGAACPNCGSDLYKGHKDIPGENIVVCRDNSDPPNGCQAAWDLTALEKEEVYAPGPWSAEAAPELGPANEAEPVTNTPDPDPTKEQFEAPVNAPEPAPDLQ